MFVSIKKGTKNIEQALFVKVPHCGLFWYKMFLEDLIDS